MRDGLFWVIEGFDKARSQWMPLKNCVTRSEARKTQVEIKCGRQNRGALTRVVQYVRQGGAR